jgi:hypothetical protein
MSRLSSEENQSNETAKHSQHQIFWAESFFWEDGKAG